MEYAKRLFGADGIRSPVDHYPLTVQAIRRLGQVFGNWMWEQVTSPICLIGADTRESCHRLKKALVEGLLDTGVEIIDAGILPTAAVSYLIASKGYFIAGAMISASHGPLEENGIKLFDHRGVKLSDCTERQVEDRFCDDQPLRMHPSGASVTAVPEFVDQYATSLACEYMGMKWGGVHVLLDCANGAAYRAMPEALNQLGVRYTLVNASPNGTNINHMAGSEYARLNPKQCAAQMARHRATIGVAFDGDADRVLFVDPDGRLYDGDMSIAMLAYHLLQAKQLKGDAVVLTQMSNTGLTDYLLTLDIDARQVQNGDKYVTEAILTDDLTLGGEQVGHVIIRTDDTRVTGDGLRTALHILQEIEANSGKLLRDLAPGMHKVPQVNASAQLCGRLRRPAQQIHGLPDLIERTRQQIPELTRFECRPASTEPVYRVMLESRAMSTGELARYAHRLACYVQDSLDCAGYPISILDCVTGGLIDPATFEPTTR